MAQATSKCHCSVPLCTSSKRKQPYLSFHGFPRDTIEQKKWIQAIRREESNDFKILRGSTFVCSRHFNESDYSETSLEGARKRLKFRKVPSCFQWNNWGVFRGESAHDGVTEHSDQDPPPYISKTESRSEVSFAATSGGDHNYAYVPPIDGPEPESVHMQRLEVEDQKLETELTLKVDHLLFHKFCVSNDDIRFYTKFPSKEVFHAFWEAVHPSASTLIHWSKAQKKGHMLSFASPSPQHTLQLIDEFFLYCCHVAAGLKEEVLAEIFQVSINTVYRIVKTWANYLYLILGSVPIWMSRHQVSSTMPLKYKHYSPEMRVIIDCTEVQCQSPSSHSLQSEVSSSNKDAATFKGLIGIAPCGTVTFVSSLYTGSISDEELTERSGLLDLLEPGDGCMAEGGFTIEKMLADCGATLITLPSNTTVPLSAEDALKTQAIAQLRILVERVISRVKEYHIWDNTVPLTLFGTVNELWTNCCLMTNFQGPLD
ncbi:uncharacterized protein LOC117811358 [Notolabrus celidotus]|uniref:uncharacterized protein LOC117811358 n=1 Tax=Notolabrus celidotus TaxID=1203425 RepID=UPI00148FA02E|nr:uncharacterized protein LOC117811358 [Notolabrus celidotus]